MASRLARFALTLLALTGAAVMVFAFIDPRSPRPNGSGRNDPVRDLKSVLDFTHPHYDPDGRLAWLLEGAEARFGSLLDPVEVRSPRMILFTRAGGGEAGRTFTISSDSARVAVPTKERGRFGRITGPLGRPARGAEGDDSQVEVTFPGRIECESEDGIRFACSAVSVRSRPGPGAGETARATVIETGEEALLNAPGLEVSGRGVRILGSTMEFSFDRDAVACLDGGISRIREISPPRPIPGSLVLRSPLGVRVSFPPHAAQGLGGPTTLAFPGAFTLEDMVPDGASSRTESFLRAGSGRVEAELDLSAGGDPASAADKVSIKSISLAGGVFASNFGPGRVVESIYSSQSATMEAAPSRVAWSFSGDPRAMIAGATLISSGAVSGRVWAIDSPAGDLLDLRSESAVSIVEESFGTGATTVLVATSGPSKARSSAGTPQVAADDPAGLAADPAAAFDSLDSGTTLTTDFDFGRAEILFRREDGSLKPFRAEFVDRLTIRDFDGAGSVDAEFEAGRASYSETVDGKYVVRRLVAEEFRSFRRKGSVVLLPGIQDPGVGGPNDFPFTILGLPGSAAELIAKGGVEGGTFLAESANLTVTGGCSVSDVILGDSGNESVLNARMPGRGPVEFEFRANPLRAFELRRASSRANPSMTWSETGGGVTTLDGCDSLEWSIERMERSFWHSIRAQGQRLRVVNSAPAGAGNSTLSSDGRVEITRYFQTREKGEGEWLETVVSLPEKAAISRTDAAGPDGPAAWAMESGSATARLGPDPAHSRAPANESGALLSRLFAEGGVSFRGRDDRGSFSGHGLSLEAVLDGQGTRYSCLLGGPAALCFCAAGEVRDDGDPTVPTLNDCELSSGKPIAFTADRAGPGMAAWREAFTTGPAILAARGRETGRDRALKISAESMRANLTGDPGAARVLEVEMKGKVDAESLGGATEQSPREWGFKARTARARIAMPGASGTRSGAVLESFEASGSPSLVNWSEQGAEEARISGSKMTLKSAGGGSVEGAVQGPASAFVDSTGSFPPFHEKLDASRRQGAVFMTTPGPMFFRMREGSASSPESVEAWTTHAADLEMVSPGAGDDPARTSRMNSESIALRSIKSAKGNFGIPSAAGRGRTTIVESGGGITITATGLDLAYSPEAGTGRFDGRDLQVKVEESR